MIIGTGLGSFPQSDNASRLISGDGFTVDDRLRRSAARNSASLRTNLGSCQVEIPTGMVSWLKKSTIMTYPSGCINSCRGALSKRSCEKIGDWRCYVNGKTQNDKYRDLDEGTTAAPLETIVSCGLFGGDKRLAGYVRQSAQD